METTNTTTTNHKKELRDRVEAKKKKLEARLAELKADSRSGAREERERIRTKLNEASEALRSGWDQVTEAGAKKLNAWLER